MNPEVRSVVLAGSRKGQEASFTREAANVGARKVFQSTTYNLYDSVYDHDTACKELISRVLKLVYHTCHTKKHTGRVLKLFGESCSAPTACRPPAFPCIFRGSM